MHTQQSSKSADQLVLSRLVAEGEDNGGAGGDVARATHLQEELGVGRCTVRESIRVELLCMGA